MRFIACFGAVFLASLNLVFVESALADPPPCGGNQTIIADCGNVSVVSGGIYTIQEGVTVSNIGNSYAVSGSGISAISITNSGTLLSGPTASGALQLDNASTISGGIWNTATGKMQSENMWAGIGIANVSSVSGGILNQGQILSNSGSALTLYNQSSVDVITNLGLIKSNNGTHDVEVGLNSSVGTLNNFQGTYGSGGLALRIKGSMPANYNLIGYGDQYGQLSVLPNSDPNSPLGTLTFDVFAGDAGKSISGSRLKTRVYENVVTGIEQSDFDNTFTNGVAFGQYNGVAWALATADWRDGTLDAFGQTLPTNKIWDLVVLNFGEDLANPQRTTIELRQHAIRTSLDYDCEQFDKDKENLCITFKARYSNLGDKHEGAGVLIAAKRIDVGLHVGAFIDHSVAENDNDPIRRAERSPLFGLFAVYSGGMDGTGLQARFSAAYEQGTLSISRMNIIDPTTDTRDKVEFEGFGFANKIGWGFGLGNQIVLTPYLGLQKTEAKRAAYTEEAADVPMTYDSYGQRRFTGMIGGELEGVLSKGILYHIGVGLEYDFANRLDDFKAYSPIDGLGDMTYSNTTKANVVRGIGEAGLGFILDDDRTVTLEGNLSQMDYGHHVACSIMAGYRMAF